MLGIVVEQLTNKGPRIQRVCCFFSHGLCTPGVDIEYTLRIVATPDNGPFPTALSAQCACGLNWTGYSTRSLDGTTPQDWYELVMRQLNAESVA